MYIKMSLDEFKDVWKKLKKFVKKSSQFPAINSMGVSFDSDMEPFFSVTDLETETVYKHPKTVSTADRLKVEDPIRTVIPADTLKIIEKIKQNDAIIITPGKLQVGSRQIEFKDLHEECPLNPISQHFDDEKDYFVANLLPQDLKEKLSIIGPALEVGETKPAFKGVCLRDNKLWATDSYRLAWRQLPMELPDTEHYDIIIPAKPLKHVKEMLPVKTENPARIYLDQNVKKSLITWHIEGDFLGPVMEVYMKNIEEKWPHLDKVMPNNFATEIKVNTENLIEELDFLQQLDKDIKTDLDIKGSNCELECINYDNKVTSNIHITKEGEDIHLIVNARYLNEALKRNKETVTEIKISGAYSPLIVNETELILPCRSV